MVAPGCAALAGCQVIDLDAGNCDLFATTTFGCNGGIEDTQVQAGLLTFDAAQGQSCLNAITARAGSCTAATTDAVNAACRNYLLLRPAVALNGACLFDDECIPPVYPDGGSPKGSGLFSRGSITTILGGPTIYSNLFGCDVTTTLDSLTCGGTCSYGHPLGDVCSTVAASGAGCAEGYCNLSFLPDGGSADLCEAFSAIGQPCGARCDPTGMCGLVEDGGSVCLAYGGLGADCDLQGCNSGGCSCTSGLYCADPGDGGPTGTCATPNGPGATCTLSNCQYSNLNCPCDVSQTYCQPPDDGGGTEGACAPKGDAGTICTPSFCPPGGGVGCECYPHMFCEQATDGGFTYACVAKVGAGGACTQLGCQYPTETSCECDDTSVLYCDPSTNTCQPRGGAQALCSSTSYFPCLDGFVCGGDGSCDLIAPVDAGAACSPNAGSYCQGGLICSGAASGVCTVPATLGEACNPFASPADCSPYSCVAKLADGGSMCLPNVGLGGDCSVYPCQDLLDCVSVAFPDAGSRSICEAESTVSDGGAACDPNDPNACVLGFCDPAALTCLPYLPVGTSCGSAPIGACGPLAGCDPQTSTCQLRCNIRIVGGGTAQTGVTQSSR